MRGTNRVVKQDLDANLFRVKEIFPTLQGEGPHAGRPAIFVRFAGCNLRCSFCDTDFDSPYVDMDEGELYDAIHDKASDHGDCTLVVFTGGEPLLQPIADIAHILHGDGMTVQVETAGTVWVPELYRYAEFVVSPKTPHVNEEFYKKEHNVVAWKYIVQAYMIDDAGYPFAAVQGDGNRLDTEGKHIARPPTWMPGHMIYFQPCDVMDKTEKQRNTQAAVELTIMHNARVSLQQHKILHLR